MFSCGARHGRGLQEWRDGSAYSGDFDGGVRRGQGRMRYPAGGASYVGSWENDTRHGRGVYYGKDQVLEQSYKFSTFKGFSTRLIKPFSMARERNNGKVQ